MAKKIYFDMFSINVYKKILLRPWVQQMPDFIVRHFVLILSLDTILVFFAY